MQAPEARLSVRLPAALAEDFERAAASEERTVSSALRTAIRLYIDAVPARSTHASNPSREPAA
jgi:hypothetical protein